MIEHNDEYSEKFRIYVPRTDVGTLLRLRPLLKTIGMDKMLKDGKASGGDLTMAILKTLADTSLLNEFCQIVTGKTDVDFINTAQSGNLMWLVHDFFADLWWQMPPSWRAQTKKWMQDLVELGKAELTGLMTQPTGSIANEPSI